MVLPSQARKLIILILLMGGSILFSGWICSLVFPLIPSDFSRTGRLLRFINKESPSNSSVILGNSIAMDGVNANLVEQTMGCPEEHVFNLSSPGQNQLESLLLISSMAGRRPKRIIHMLNASDLGYQDFLSQQVIYNFLLFGYKPNDFLIDALSITNNAFSLKDFGAGRFKIAFENRYLVTNYLNASFRKLLRNDLSLDHLEDDVRYPRNYTARLPDSKRLPLIQQANPKAPVHSFRMDTVKWEIIRRTAEYLHTMDIEYIVVLSPINPELDNFQPSFYREMDTFFRSNFSAHVQFINLSTLLTKEEFVDHVHPDGTGAIKISSEIAKHLPSCSSKQ